MDEILHHLGWLKPVVNNGIIIILGGCLGFCPSTVWLCNMYAFYDMVLHVCYPLGEDLLPNRCIRGCWEPQQVELVAQLPFPKHHARTHDNWVPYYCTTRPFGMQRRFKESDIFSVFSSQCFALELMHVVWKLYLFNGHLICVFVTVGGSEILNNHLGWW